jgi:integrase
MEEILKNISVDDIEKLRMLLSIIPGQEQKEVVTIRVFINEYCNLIKQNRSKAYYTSVECAFKHMTDFFESRKSIRSIELKDVEKFVTYLQQRVKKGYRVYYRTLKAAFNKAVGWGYVKENYFHKVKLQKKQQVNPAFINSDQLSVINYKIKIAVIKDFIVFAFYTGMRLNEIINLTWRNVDLEARIITVGDESFTTKGKNQRYIPICEEVYEIIVRRKRKDVRETPSFVLPLEKGGEVFQYVFCKKDGSKYCGNYVSRKFKNACKAADMDQSIHFHSLRHSFASNLAQKGVSLYTIKELLGHSSITTTEIYSHLNMDSLREAIKKLDSPQPNLLPKGGGENHLKIFRINSGEKR